MGRGERGVAGWVGGGAFMLPYALARSLMPALTPAVVIADAKGGRSLTTCPESLMRRVGVGVKARVRVGVGARWGGHAWDGGIKG